MSFFPHQQQQSSMNLPVASHIDKLTDLLSEINYELDIAEKDLHILRGQITQLSFVNKQADQELNDFLIDSISTLRQKWEGEWIHQSQQIVDCKKKVTKIFQQQEDVDILRQSLQEKVQTIEHMVGIL